MHALAKKIIARLSAKKQRLCVVESITGGRISAALTAIPGASEVFFAGGIFYNSDAKRQFLDIEFEEVFSPETAEKMAQSFREKCDADFCLATTGRAEDGEKTFFALAMRDALFSAEKTFSGGRDAIQRATTTLALTFLAQKIVA